MDNKKTLYCVGNAHLDPAWMWKWQEGSASAKATVRSALDRMKEYPDFKFVCSSASVYKWIEDFDPKMFEEVKERVKEGRFIVVGGWFVQPDCNMPSGEGFARQSLYCQRYFKEKLGVTATTGYNVDSFGHNLMLPQILKKSGMKQYVFMRPGTHEKTMESDVFRWQSPDGSEVLTYRLPDPYCLYTNTLEELEAKLADNSQKYKYTDKGHMLFYGVGNHGGGPTKKNINVMKEYAKKHPELNVVFSDINDYFSEIEKQKDTLIVHKDDLQHHASGCYAAVSRIKNDVRRAETSLLAAETYNVMAEKLCGKAPATKKLAKAWENVLISHFHDVMGGCCIKPAYDDFYNMLGESRAVAAETENSALQTVSWAIDTSDSKKGYPIVIFNPHSFAVTETVSVNAQASVITDSKGEAVPVQHVASRWCWKRDNTAFTATVPPMGYATYYIKTEEEIDGPLCMKYRGEIKAEFENSIKVYDNGFENDRISVKFDKHSGYITSFFDKEKSVEVLNGKGAVPVVIDENAHDTWSHARNFFDNEIGKFTDARFTVLENGPVRAVIKVESFYGASKLTQYFTLNVHKNSLDVRAIVDWHEKHKMLKIAFETATENTKAIYEIPFGVIERPADGEEECGQMWILAKGDSFGAALINDNKYSFSVKDGVMNLTAIRSPIYCDHGGARTEESEYTDQGESEFNYSFRAYGNDEGYASIVKEAKLFNTPLTHILENNHEGYLADSFSGIKCDSENVTVSAVKFSEDGCGTVVRVYETDGRDTEFTLDGSILPVPLKSKIGAFSVNTYYLEKGIDTWKEVLLTEYDI